MHPEWVTKHKQKGTNISHINGKYYLYAVNAVNLTIAVALNDYKKTNLK